MGKDRDFIFGRQVGHSKFQLTDDKSFLKEAWSGHVAHLIVCSPNHILGPTEARVVKFCIRVDIASVVLQMTNCSVMDMVRVT